MKHSFEAMAHPHSHRARQQVPVHRITEAHESHTVDHNSRVLKYTISMTIRVICFVAAFFTHGPLQWIMLVGAIVLPYIAVVIANRGADITKREPPAEFFTERDAPQLSGTTPAAQQPGPEPEDEPEVIDGSWVDPAPGDTARKPGPATSESDRGEA